MLSLHVADLIQTYGYTAVALGTFLEGETFLLLGGAAAAHGHLSLLVVIGLATLASFLGDQLFFIIGRRYGARLLTRFPSLEPRAEKVKRLLDRYHLPFILLIRFMYGLRIAGPITIGMSRVSWLRFLTLNFFGAMLWAFLIANLGYGAGQIMSNVLKHLDADEWWFIAAIVGVIVWLLQKYLWRRDTSVNS